MSRLLIGSSNVYRHYRASAYKKYPECAMIRCVDFESFSAQLVGLDSCETEVIISVLENFLEKSIQGGAGNEVLLDNFGSTIESFMASVRSAAIRLPNSRFSLAEPIKRPKNPQYQNHFEDIIKAFSEAVVFARRDNISKIEAIAEGCQQFEADEVHLTGASGQIFLEGLLTKSEAFFAAPFVNLTTDEEEGEDTSVTDMLSKRLEKLENQVKTRRNEDNIVFARIREEMDSATN